MSSCIGIKIVSLYYLFLLKIKSQFIVSGFCELLNIVISLKNAGFYLFVILEKDFLEKHVHYLLNYHFHAFTEAPVAEVV